MIKSLDWLTLTVIAVVIAAFAFMAMGLAYFGFGVATTLVDIVRGFPASFQGDRMILSLVMTVSTVMFVVALTQLVRGLLSKKKVGDCNNG